MEDFIEKYEDFELDVDADFAKFINDVLDVFKIDCNEASMMIDVSRPTVERWSTGEYFPHPLMRNGMVRDTFIEMAREIAYPIHPEVPDLCPGMAHDENGWYFGVSWSYDEVRLDLAHRNDDQFHVIGPICSWIARQAGDIELSKEWDEWTINCHKNQYLLSCNKEHPEQRDEIDSHKFYAYYRSYFHNTDSWYVEVSEDEYNKLLSSANALRMGNWTELSVQVQDRKKIDLSAIGSSSLFVEIAVC